MGKNQNSNLPSLTGKVFGKWTVGQGTIEKTSKKGTAMVYSCTCTCGTVQGVRYSRLVKGHSSQCVNCRSIKDVCKRGHDTAIYGRTPNGICRMCARENSVQYKYGMSAGEYEALFNFQGGKCAICGRKLALLKIPGKPQEAGRAEVDHKHLLKKQAKLVPKKDTVRGILCGGRWAGCNHKLGKVDNIDWLRSAATYLENPPAHQLFRKEQ